MAIYAEVVAEVKSEDSAYHGYVERAIVHLHAARQELQKYHKQNPSDWVAEGVEQIEQTVISLW